MLTIYCVPCVSIKYTVQSNCEVAESKLGLKEVSK